MGLDVVGVSDGIWRRREREGLVASVLKHDSNQEVNSWQ